LMNSAVFQVSKSSRLNPRNKYYSQIMWAGTDVREPVRMSVSA
jgi:hypothetical protein